MLLSALLLLSSGLSIDPGDTDRDGCHFNQRTGERHCHAAPAARPTQAAREVYYANCDAVRAAGRAPLRRGQPGYRRALDRDNDGVACER